MSRVVCPMAVDMCVYMYVLAHVYTHILSYIGQTMNMILFCKCISLISMNDPRIVTVKFNLITVVTIIILIRKN